MGFPVVASLTRMYIVATHITTTRSMTTMVRPVKTTMSHVAFSESHFSKLNPFVVADAPRADVPEAAAWMGFPPGSWRTAGAGWRTAVAGESTPVVVPGWTIA